jgi:hypothetical protein
MMAISPHERLTATLRYLATGRTYEDLKFHHRLSLPLYQKHVMLYTKLYIRSIYR